MLIKRYSIIFQAVLTIFLLSCSKNKVTPEDVIAGNNSCLADHGVYKSINENESYDYFYDVDGRLIKIKNNSFGIEISYTYSTSEIIVIEPNNIQYYKLDEKGRIKNKTSNKGENIEYSYNVEGYLTEVKYIDNCNSNLNIIEKYSYLNGNLTSYQINDGKAIIIEYGSELAVENFFIYEKKINLPFVLYSPLKRFFGKLSKNLPSQKKISSGAETYNYAKDVGGNVNKLVVKSTDGIDFTIEKNYTCK
ncbi:hypothetical protein ACTJKN_15860 [Pedobacter sp. 22163]|uniref:hypothetical protein n=1 Tax=Pedobacter sp. 22163 TaxID=3453883 RepID=UPI003F836C2E